MVAGQLGSANQRGGPLELLRGQQPQRVPHQHRDPSPSVQWPVRGVQEGLPPPDRERVRGEPEVRLGLAATGREEQQLCGGQVAGALRCRGIGEQGKLHQHERELEREPGVRLLRSLGEHLVAGLIDRLGGVRGAAPGDLALHALVGHHVVHEPEAAQRFGVGEQVLQPGRELFGNLAGLGDGV